MEVERKQSVIPKAAALSRVQGVTVLCLKTAVCAYDACNTRVADDAWWTWVDTGWRTLKRRLARRQRYKEAIAIGK